MEGKTVVMAVLLLSLVVGQIQAEEKIVMVPCPCCPSFAAYREFNTCYSRHHSVETCASLVGCEIKHRLVDTECPCPRPQKTGGDAVNEYCKLGCVSSVCGAIATLENIDGGEVVDGAVEKCVMACSDVCTKNPIKTA